MCVAFGVAFGLAKPDQIVREDGTSIAVFDQLSWNYGKEGILFSSPSSTSTDTIIYPS
jgi:hypothetical protein